MCGRKINLMRIDTSKIGEHSKNKKCLCGGHNLSNVKSNLNHHSTRIKLYRRKIKKFFEKIKQYN